MAGAGGMLDQAMHPEPSARTAARRTQDERSAATREALVSATAALIAESGYAAATTTAIAARAGVSRGALHHQFDDRDDLMLAVIEDIMNRINFQLDGRPLQGRPLRERAEALVDHYRSVFAGPTFRAALGIWTGVQGEPALLGRVRDLLRAAQSRFDEAWLTAFADLPAASRAGLLAARRLAMSTVRGYAVLEMFGTYSAWPQDRAVAVAMVETAIAQALPAMPPRPATSRGRRSGA